MSIAVTSDSPRPVSRWIWPGILIALPASVIVASIITAVFVLRHPDGLVASDYYKQGRMINARLALHEAARDMGLADPRIEVAPSELRLRFRAQDFDEPIAYVLAHPVDPARDVQGMAHRDARGDYRIVLAEPLDGRRNLLLSDVAGKRWRVEARIEATQAADARRSH